MASNLQPISIKQFLVTIEGQQFYFTKSTAPKEDRDTIEYNDGQTGQTKKFLGFMTLDDVTLSKPFDPVQDKGLISYIKGLKNDVNSRFTVTIQPVNNDVQGTPISGASTIKLTGCQVKAIRYPEVDRVGNGSAMLELEIIPDAISYS